MVLGTLMPWNWLRHHPPAAIQVSSLLSLCLGFDFSGSLFILLWSSSHCPLSLFCLCFLICLSVSVFSFASLFFLFSESLIFLCFSFWHSIYLSGPSLHPLIPSVPWNRIGMFTARSEEGPWHWDAWDLGWTMVWPEWLGLFLHLAFYLGFFLVNFMSLKSQDSIAKK